MEKQFADFYVRYVYTLLAISIVINAVMSVIIWLTPNYAEKYLKYTVSFVAADFMFSIVTACTMPYLYQSPELCALFSISPKSYKTDAFLIWLWYIIILGVAILVTASFVHRHAVVCNSCLLQIFDSKKGFIIIVLIPVVSALWIASAALTLSSDVSSLRVRLNSELGVQLGIDFQSNTIVAIIWKIYCAWTIHQTIKHAAFSKILMQKHSKALRVLILQSINPLVFLYAPFLLLFVASALKVEYHYPEKITDLMIHFFPITNALIILTMTDEYRRAILKRVHIIIGTDRSLTMF